MASPASRTRRRSPASSAKPVRFRRVDAMSSDDVLGLQRTAGNQAVQRLVGGALRLGSRGPEVGALQQKLNAAGAGLASDGSFGGKTQQAVVAFQRAAGLVADGVVGAKTNAALDAGRARIGGGVAAGGKGGADPRLSKLGALLQAIKSKLEGRGPAGDGGPPSLKQPELRAGLFDDAADWVEEQVDAATDWVEDKVEEAGAAVEGAADWVEDAAGAAAETVTDSVAGVAEAVGEAAAGAVDQVLDEAKELASEVQSLVGEVAGALGEKGEQLISLLQDLAGGVVPAGSSLDDLITQATAVLAGLGEVTDELKGAAVGAGTLNFSQAKGTDPAFVFSDATFTDLRVRLTARSQEMGSARPSAPALTLNGQAAPPPSDEVVKKATVTVVETVQLPSWTNVDGAAVQAPQKAEWERYVGAMSAHEQLHAADDKGIYEKMATSLPGKTFAQAYAAADDATTEGDGQGPKRDGSNPPPTLNPAGVEKQP